MKNRNVLGLALVLGLVHLWTGSSAAADLGTAFTYQGELSDGQGPVNGSFDIDFALFDDPDYGTQIGPTITLYSLQVVDGRITASLDFGDDAFNGDARWLAITVNGSLLNPRQPVTPTPYALGMKWFRTIGERVIIGGARTNSVDEGLVGATISGGGSNASPNTVTGSVGTVGGGQDNTAGLRGTVSGGLSNTASGTASTVGGGQNNLATGQNGTIPGGFANEASGLNSFAAGRRARAVNGGAFVWADGTDVEFVSTASDQFLVRAGGGFGIGTNSPSSQLSVAGDGDFTGTLSAFGFATQFGAGGESPNLVAGHNENTVGDEADGAVVAGGGAKGFPNQAIQDNDTVSGGVNNTVDGGQATISGGINNLATGFSSTIGGGNANQASNEGSTVGGGALNSALGLNSTVSGGVSNTATANAATVAGGQVNAALAAGATVGGGQNNVAAGVCSVVAGGCGSSATGDYSFAAGQGAFAPDEGSFVWSDASASEGFASSGPNQFSIRATGGVRLVSAVSAAGTPTASIELKPGASAWSALSSRSAKENFQPVDGESVLAALASIPIATWNYKTQDASVRHIGPMAEDFHAAFGMGEDAARISTIDSDGIALAAIQGLHQVVRDRDEKIQSLQVENESLQERLARLEEVVAALVAGGER